MRTHLHQHRDDPDFTAANPWGLQPQSDAGHRLTAAIRELREEREAELTPEQRERFSPPDTYGIFEEARR